MVNENPILMHVKRVPHCCQIYLSRDNGTPQTLIRGLALRQEHFIDFATMPSLSKYKKENVNQLCLPHLLGQP